METRGSTVWNKATEPVATLPASAQHRACAGRDKSAIKAQRRKGTRLVVALMPCEADVLGQIPDKHCSEQVRFLPAATK